MILLFSSLETKGQGDGMAYDFEFEDFKSIFLYALTPLPFLTAFIFMKTLLLYGFIFSPLWLNKYSLNRDILTLLVYDIQLTWDSSIERALDCESEDGIFNSLSPHSLVSVGSCENIYGIDLFLAGRSLRRPSIFLK